MKIMVSCISIESYDRENIEKSLACDLRHDTLGDTGKRFLRCFRINFSPQRQRRESIILSYAKIIIRSFCHKAIMARAPRKKEDLRYCLVWSPLPPITWIIPIIGHVGIADSNGIASDFRGPYYVGDDGNMAFGEPTRAVFIPVDDSELWDRAIREANDVYRGRMHKYVIHSTKFFCEYYCSKHFHLTLETACPCFLVSFVTIVIRMWRMR